jgi:hypothetical protein
MGRGKSSSGSGSKDVESPVKARKGKNSKHAGNEDDDARADAIDEARARDAQEELEVMNRAG